MAKALYGHVGSRARQRMLDEVTRLRAGYGNWRSRSCGSARRTTGWSRPRGREELLRIAEPALA